MTMDDMVGTRQPAPEKHRFLFYGFSELLLKNINVLLSPGNLGDL